MILIKALMINRLLLALLKPTVMYSLYVPTALGSVASLVVFQGQFLHLFSLSGLGKDRSIREDLILL